MNVAQGVVASWFMRGSVGLEGTPDADGVPSPSMAGVSLYPFASSSRAPGNVRLDGTHLDDFEPTRAPAGWVAAYGYASVAAICSYEMGKTTTLVLSLPAEPGTEVVVTRDGDFYAAQCQGAPMGHTCDPASDPRVRFVRRPASRGASVTK